MRSNVVTATRSIGWLVCTRFKNTPSRGWSSALAWTLAILALALPAEPARAQADRLRGNTAEATIDPFSGQVSLTITDLVITAGPINLEVSRSLEQRKEPGLLGTRWRSGWESRVVRTKPHVVIEEAPHSVSFSPSSAGGGFVSRSGDRLVFEKDGRAVRTRLDGRRDIFDAKGRLIEQDLRNGNKVVLRYGADGQLARIEGPRGSFFQFVLDSGRRIVEAQSSSGATVRYGYVNQELSEVRVNGGPPLRYSYDARGALSRIDDPKSGAIDLAYDANGRLVSRRWADGAQERFEYDDASNRQRRIDPTGATTTTQWSRDRRRVEVTDPLGGKTVIAFNAAGRAESITGPMGATVWTSYDPLGRTVAVRDPRGQLTRFEYAGRTSRLKSITHADGTRESLDYDAQLNPTAAKVLVQTVAAFSYNPDGTLRTAQPMGLPERRLSYDAQGRLQSVANALDQRIDFTYDARGNPVRAVNPLGGVTVWQRDAQGRLVSETDAAGRITRYEYDASGRLSRIIDPAAGVTRFEYDVRGRLTVETSPTGNIIRYAYDPAGRLSKVTDREGSDSFSYDAAGNLRERVDRLGRSTHFERDPRGRLIRERSSTGIDIQYRYDALGQLSAVENSSGAKQEWQRDGRGRVIAVRDALGATRQYEYDSLGNVTSRKDARGQAKNLAYSGHNTLARVQEPTGDIAEYRYDAANRLVGIVRPSGGTTRLSYDALGNLTEEIDPLGHKRSYSYDVAGRRVASTDAAGWTFRYSYDTAGRLTEKRLPNNKHVIYRYDAAGNLVEADDGAFPVRYQYDRAGRLTRMEYPSIKKAVGYQYDAQGLRTRLIGPDGHVTSYEYNKYKQLVAIVPADGKRITLSYDTQERIHTIQYPNGLTGRRDYDAAGRVTKLSYINAKSKPAQAWSYRYDADGNLLEQQAADGQVSRYNYDAAGQLIEAAGPGAVVRYRYGRGGNRVASEEGASVTEYRHDAADRLIRAGQEDLAYDASGNLIRRSGTRGTTTYEYDAENRLTKVQPPNGATTTFGYAPTGERVWKRDAEGLTYYLYDGLDLIAELNERGKAKASYAYGPGIDQPLAMLREGKSYYYHPDRLGSIRLLTDAKGQIAASYDYDAFGKLATVKHGVANSFTFTGREWDASTGLYYYRARYYDPVHGRFLTKDPRDGELARPVTFNEYLYVENRPFKFRDPLGLVPTVSDLWHYTDSHATAASIQSSGFRCTTVGGTTGVCFTELGPGSIKNPIRDIGIEPAKASVGVRVPVKSLTDAGYVIDPDPRHPGSWIVRNQHVPRPEMANPAFRRIPIPDALHPGDMVTPTRPPGVHPGFRPPPSGSPLPGRGTLIGIGVGIGVGLLGGASPAEAATNVATGMAESAGCAAIGASIGAVVGFCSPLPWGAAAGAATGAAIGAALPDVVGLAQTAIAVGDAIVDVLNSPTRSGIPPSPLPLPELLGLTPPERTDRGSRPPTPDQFGPTPDQLARAGGLSGEFGAGLPNVGQQQGGHTGGRPGYQPGQEVPVAMCPDASGKMVPCPLGMHPPGQAGYDPRQESGRRPQWGTLKPLPPGPQTRSSPSPVGTQPTTSPQPQPQSSAPPITTKPAATAKAQPQASGLLDCHDDCWKKCKKGSFGNHPSFQTDTYCTRECKGFEGVTTDKGSALYCTNTQGFRGFSPR